MAKKPVAGSSNVVLPRQNLAGKARAQRPGSDLDKGQTIRNDLNRHVESAIASVRTRTDINEIIRVLVRQEGLFSSAANAMVALAAQSGFRVAGYDAEGRMSSEVMAAAYAVMDSWDTLHDYSQGFNDKQSLGNLLSTLQTDVITTGGCGVELVLDKQFGPERLLPIGYSTIEWEAKGGNQGRYPTQDRCPTGVEPGPRAQGQRRALRRAPQQGDRPCVMIPPAPPSSSCYAASRCTVWPRPSQT